MAKLKKIYFQKNSTVGFAETVNCNCNTVITVIFTPPLQLCKTTETADNYNYNYSITVLQFLFERLQNKIYLYIYYNIYNK